MIKVKRSGVRSNRVFLSAAIAMTLVQLWVAHEPLVGQAVGRPHMHAVAHFASYLVLSFAWVFGLPAVPSTAIALAVSAFGFGQEALEIVGHGHGLEMRDVAIDAAGAIAGATLGGFLRQLWAKSQ
jgi:VanZ family protein